MRLTMMDHMRFRFCFSAARREAIKNAALVAGLFVVFAITGTLDYQDELRQQAEAAEAREALSQAALVACLNGGAPGLYTIDADGTRHYLVCDTPYTVSDENTHRNTTQGEPHARKTVL